IANARLFTERARRRRGRGVRLGLGARAGFGLWPLRRPGGRPLGLRPRLPGRTILLARLLLGGLLGPFSCLTARRRRIRRLAWRRRCRRFRRLGRSFGLLRVSHGPFLTIDRRSLLLIQEVVDSQ